MKGIDYRTGHVWEMSPKTGVEVHSDYCPHWSHGRSPFSTIAIPPDNATFDADTVRRMTDAEVQRHGAQQLRKDWDALMAEFYGDTERQAIEAVAPEPPEETS